jgi:hypothetical protein
MLENVRYLKEEHNDGRLFKMFEDTVLALVVKNYMEYDYVVGNPPYVRVQNLPDEQKTMLEKLYSSTTGNYDIYCPFYERGLDWLSEDTGKLGYITPNQFAVTDYGEGLRQVLLDDARIEEVYDFRDSGVFEDATNYPAIVIAEDEPDEAVRADNDIRCVRVKADTDDDEGRELDEAIIDGVRDHRGEPGYSDDLIDVFDFPQEKLSSEDYWGLMPRDEWNVIKKLEEKGEHRIEEVADSVFAGTQTSANDVFIATPVEREIVQPDETGETVSIVPQGSTEEHQIESDLLRPWLQGRDVERWRGKWSGQHVVSPYQLQTDSSGEVSVSLLSQDTLKSEYPLTWEYLSSHRSTLESREDGRFEGRDDWYCFGYPKSMNRFEKPKLIGAEISSEATFMLDEIGLWYFKSAYGLQLKNKYKNKTELFVGLLNSKCMDFYLKHYTSLKMGGYYKYTTNYLAQIPILWNNSASELISKNISEITNIIDLENKKKRFPEAYLGDYDGELQYIDYEWQTRRYPVSADVQGDVNDEFTVQAGRTDTIRDPAMYSDDREARKRRAEYVHAAVDGRNVKRGEEMSIPIPRSDAGVEELLTRLEEDRERIAETDIDALEAEIDEAVYDLFDLTPDERAVVEEYLEVF